MTDAGHFGTPAPPFLDCADAIDHVAAVPRGVYEAEVARWTAQRPELTVLPWPVREHSGRVRG